jgi:hypothetical protein
MYNSVVPYPDSPLNKTPDVQSAFVMVDVCHSSIPQASEDDEMPTVVERPRAAAPVLSCAYMAPIRIAFIQFLLDSQNGHPPEA